MKKDDNHNQIQHITCASDLNLECSRSLITEKILGIYTAAVFGIGNVCTQIVNLIALLSVTYKKDPITVKQYVSMILFVIKISVSTNILQENFLSLEETHMYRIVH